MKPKIVADRDNPAASTYDRVAARMRDKARVKERKMLSRLSGMTKAEAKAIRTARLKRRAAKAARNLAK